MPTAISILNIVTLGKREISDGNQPRLSEKVASYAHVRARPACPLRAPSAALYELPDRTAFCAACGSRPLRGTARGDACGYRAFALPARAVLPRALPLLRLPYDRGA